MPASFRHAVLGGTFDHFHRGHAQLIYEACSNSEKVTIGISLPELSQHKNFQSSIQDFQTRQQSVEFFLRELKVLEKTSIIPLSDIYGTTLTDQSIDAIFVTEDTEKNAELINKKRSDQNMQSLTINVVPFIMADDGKRISSERIRKGEIDRLGSSYSIFFQSKTSYSLPDSLRQQLQQPIGFITKNPDDVREAVDTAPSTITIGDITSLTLVKNDIFPTLAVIDQKSQRQSLPIDEMNTFFAKPDYTLLNPAGTITTSFADILKSAIDYQIPQILKVDGEEDLLALPAILLSPLNALVIYGQKDLGMVVVQITEGKKDYVKNLLSQFL